MGALSASNRPLASHAGDGSDEGTSPSPPFPVVGIGASAGGLEALTALLASIKADSMAYVVVQHLAPDHESLLPEILGRSSPIPVHAITDGLQLERNHVYVAPPGANVGILHGVLHLMAASAQPIDAFFRSLAEDMGPRAIGVVLSGMGSDGTQGLREIKSRGGLAYCQDLPSAKFDSMPRKALDSGVVDRALSPEGLGAELMSLGKHPYLSRRPPGPLPAPLERDHLAKLFILLRSAFGNDLTLYKPSTIHRRVERRMALQKIERLADYVGCVQDNHEELAALYRDVLIGVTSFFRDGEPFEMVKRLIVPRILERKASGAALRIWVPACASGEEAYSLGICLLEALDSGAHSYRIQIFGTDVDEDGVARARRGVYPGSIEADVSPERLQRFFVKVGADYQVARRLRELCVFSPQNVVSDAPFSRVDLVSCRNLLIYLQSPLQRKVLRLIHYALDADGYLILGSSETVGDSAELFSLVDRKNKIYLKKNLPMPVAVRDVRETVTGTPSSSRPSEAFRVPDGKRRPGPTAQQLADRKLIELFGPPSVLVDENLEILQFRGDTAPYLTMAAGAATLNLLKLLRAELHVEVWRAVKEALKENTVVHVAPLRLTSGSGAPRLVGVQVVPIHEPDTNSRCLLVVFDEAATQAAAGDSTSPGAATAVDARVHDLEQDLATTKEYLQTTIEELETSNEELKSINEELQSTNEELQSTNEELETSKEELQSTNEELSTMNDELQHRMVDLARSNSDLDNLMLYMEHPVLFVDTEARLRRMTDSAQKLLKLTPGDLGRSLSQLQANLGGVDVEPLARETMARLTPTSQRLRLDDRWHEVRAVPYQAPGGVVDGALVLFRDVDAEQRRKQLMLDVGTYAEKLLTAMPQPLAIVDAQLRVLWVNQPFLDTFKVDVHATIGNLLQNLGSGQWAHPGLRAAMEEALTRGRAFRDFPIEHDFDTIGPREMLVSGSVVSGIAGADRVLLVTIVPLVVDARPS